jgi:dienelactone hydrolase
MERHAILGVLAISALPLVACAGDFAAVPDPDDPAGLAETWRQARIGLPKALTAGNETRQGTRDDAAVAPALANVLAGRKVPTVLYLHGCSGFGTSGKVNVALLVEAGYAVIAPDSFARPGRPATCDPKRNAVIVAREVAAQVHRMRLAEVRYALERLGEFPWVDRDNLFLFGHSQGGTAAAAYAGKGFRARVVTGTRCARGIGARSAEPVLAVFSTDDPWFKDLNVRNCWERRRGHDIEAHEFPGKTHLMANIPEARFAILEFLARHGTAR